MRKLLGVLLLLIVVVGSGTYYYLTKIFPEDQIVTLISSIADESGAEVTYQSIEPGPLGLDGLIKGVSVQVPDEAGPARIEEVYYQIDPIWIVMNLPFLIEYRTLTHYKTLEFRKIEASEASEVTKIQVVSFSGLDFSERVKEAASTSETQSDPQTELEMLLGDDVNPFAIDITFKRFAIDDLSVTSHEGTALLKSFEIADASKETIGSIQLDTLVITMPEANIQLNKIEGRNLHIPAMAFGETDAAPVFRSADYFEVSGLSIFAQGSSLFELDQMLYEENGIRSFSGLGEIATDTRFDIRGVKFRTSLVTRNVELFKFFDANQMDTLAFDFLNHGTVDVESGLMESSMVFDLYDVATLNVSITMGGFNEAFFSSMGGLFNQFFAEAFKDIWSGDFKSAQESLPATQAEAEALFMQAIQSLTLNQFMIGYDDHSLVNKGITYLVSEGATEQEARDVLYTIALGGAQSLEGVPIAGDLTAGIAEMVQNPTGFSVTATVDPPLSFGEAMGAMGSENPLAVAQGPNADRIKSELTIK